MYFAILAWALAPASHFFWKTVAASSRFAGRAQRAGLYYTPISTHLNAEEIAYIVSNCEAQAFIVSARYCDIATQTGRAIAC